jgi:drug/metabolite transporter (DMT)-like permease
MKNGKAHLALLTVNVIYAISYGFSKDVLSGYIPPFAFILIRVTGAALLFWLITAFFSSRKISSKDLGLFALCGLFGVAANQLMFFEGLKHTSTIHSSVIMVCTPILVLLFARILLKEHLNSFKIIGVSIGLLGAVLLIYSSGMSISESSAYGDVLILLNASSYGIYLVLVKPLMAKYSPLQVIKWVFTFGWVMVLPFGIAQFGDINWDFPTDIALKVIFIILFMTFFTYLLTVYGLGKVSPVVVSAYIYIQPILASLLAVAQQKENLSLLTILYGVLIMIGVLLVSLPKKTAKPHINNKNSY